jgi:hypothetical protein
VRGRELGPTKFWDWLADQELCRIPFVSADFVSQCQQCGETPCLHGAALTHHWLERARSVPEFFWLLLNRRGKNRHMAVNLQPIVHVPIMLGTNLDRTRQDLVAIVEAAFNRASWERDNMFGGEPGAPDGQR